MAAIEWAGRLKTKHPSIHECSFIQKNSFEKLSR